MKRLSGDARSDLLKRYRERVEGSLKWRNGEGYDDLWDRCIDLYRGKHFEQDGLHRADRIAVNIVFSTINIVAPSIAINDPKMVVYSQKNEDAVKAVIIETVLNYWWRHYDFQTETVLAVKDFLVLGHGWLKVGWRYVEELKTLQQNAAAGESDDPNTPLAPEDAKEPATNDVADPEIDDDPEFEVTQDRPFLERVSPKDMIVDPEAKTLTSAKWIAQRIVRPLAEVKQDKRYRLKGRQCIKPDSQLQPDWRANLDRITDDVQRCTLYEFYDMQLGTMCVFSEMGDELLLDPIPQPYAFGHPFVMIRNYEVPDFFYPMGDVEALEPLQMELDKTRTQLMNHRKRFDRKWLIREDAFDQQAVNKLQLDRDNVMIPVNGDEPLQDLIFPVPINSIDGQLYQYAEGIPNDMDRVSGVTEFQQGQEAQVRHTATEASMIQDAANSRAADKLRIVEKCMGKVAERVIQLAQQYMTQDTEVRVMNKQSGFPVWVPCSRQDVQGEYDFIVEAGSTKPLNETQRRQTAIQMLQTFAPYAQAGLVNAQELVRYVLVFGFGVQSPEKFLMGQAPQQPGEAQKSPRQSVIETINYKDAPPDIQRQMEEAVGLTPSTVGGSSPAEANLTKAIGPHVQATAQAPAQQADAQQQQMMQALQGQQQATQQSAAHAHDASMANEQHRHEHAKATVEHQHRVVEGAVGHAQAIQQGAAQHGQQMEQQDQGAQNQMTQQMLGAAMQPEEPETTATTE